MANQQQKDFDAFFQNTKPGESVKVGNLTYTMGAGGNATVSSPGNVTQSFTANTDPASLANRNSTIGASYGANYGQNYATNPQAPNVHQSTGAGGMFQLEKDLNSYRGQGGIAEADGFQFNTLQSGQMAVTTPSGQTYNVSAGASPLSIAQHVPELGYAWNEKYGTDFKVGPTTPSHMWNWAPQMSGEEGGKLMDSNMADSRVVNLNNYYRSIYGSDFITEGPDGRLQFNYADFDASASPQFDAVRASISGENPATQTSPAGNLEGALGNTPGGAGSTWALGQPIGNTIPQQTFAGGQTNAPAETQAPFDANRVRQDFSDFFANTPEGQSVQVGDLVYTRGAGDQATVTLPNGLTIPFTSGTDPMTLASISDISNSYQQNYGYQPGGQPIGGGEFNYTGGNITETNPAQAQLGEVATYNPYTEEVQYDDLVKNQLADAMNTPYAELARKRAMDEMNDRGLLNSSLAQGAATRAAIEAGMPAAQQDAQAYLETRLRSQETINNALQQNTNARNTMTQANMDAMNAFGLDMQQFSQQRALTAQEHAQQQSLAMFDRDTRQMLTQMATDSEEYLGQINLTQQNQEHIADKINENNRWIMDAIANIQKIEGLSANERNTMIEEVGVIHKANLQLLVDMNLAPIDWHGISTSINVQQDADNTQSGTQSNQYLWDPTQIDYL